MYLSSQSARRQHAKKHWFQIFALKNEKGRKVMQLESKLAIGSTARKDHFATCLL